MRIGERNVPRRADDVPGMGDHHGNHWIPAQVGRDTAGEQRLDAAARARHLGVVDVPVQRCAPTDLPRPR